MLQKCFVIGLLAASLASPLEATLIRYDFDINGFRAAGSGAPAPYERIFGNAVLDVNLTTNTVETLVGADLDIVGAAGGHFDGSNTGVAQSFFNVTIGGLANGVNVLDLGPVTGGLGGVSTDFAVTFNIANGALNPTYNDLASYVIFNFPGAFANSNGNGTVTAQLFVPEPGTMLMVLVASVVLMGWAGRRHLLAACYTLRGDE